MKTNLGLLAAVLITANTSSFASVTDNTRITSLYIDSSGNVHLHLNRNKNVAMCNGYWDYAFNGTTTIGKQRYLMAVTAWTTNAVVKITGTGNCDVGSREGLKVIRGKG